ncbi:MAG TPA: TonB-dependent receptor [Rhizomicrobium sp.]|nr:TonB-dependent receptor [Rhizomicrobium sp.]
MHNLLQKLMLGGSTAALVAASPLSNAWAQGSPGDIEQVVVSASRISIAGYAQPTPVTIVGAAQLEASAKSDIGDSIRELPSVGASSSPTNGAGNGGLSGGTGGVSTVNLRNLGITRTLILFDGQRVVQSNTSGGVDLGTVPTSLLTRVDIVTGGASAAWGSDAVAGVVNLVINKNFDGLTGNIEASDTYNDTYRTYKFQGNYGTDIFGGRGHMILSAEYKMTPSAAIQVQEKWYNDIYLVNNPAFNAVTNPGVPKLLHEPNVGFSGASAGGLIVSNPTGTVAGTANVLRGINFVGVNGTPTSFNFGNISGGLAWGGDANLYNSENWDYILAVPQRVFTLFNYDSYKISDTLKLGVQLNYGSTFNAGAAKTSINQGLVVKSDNAFIPAAVRATMTADGITSFTMGTLNSNNYDVHSLDGPNFINNATHNMAPSVEFSYRQLMRGVITLDGTVGNDWGWDAYYQHGSVRYRAVTPSNPLAGNLLLAEDSVTVTAANRGTSNLAIGSIACRDTLANPNDGCKPMNAFGEGVASQASIDYVNGYRSGIGPYGGLDTELIILTEDVLAGSAQGTLPWQLPAGPVAVAFGAEYRKEGGVTVADPRGALTSWTNANFTNFPSSSYNVMEGFAEISGSILKNDVVQSLDFDMAGRMTSYSTSGLVETWKLGLTSQVNDDIKLRTTWSTDIRAPNLQELFAPHALNQGSAIDPKTGKSVKTFSDATGNVNLVPEVALTISGGVVLTPHWVPGLQMSADWYSINIHGAIVTPSTTQILQQCALGVALYCAKEVFDGQDYPGALGHIVGSPINAASQSTSGMDFQVDYPMDLFTGTLNWHLVGNYTDETTRQFLGLQVDQAGSLGPDSSITGVPKVKVEASAGYVDGPMSLTIQGRFIGQAKLNNPWVSGVDVDNNQLPPVGYLDLRGSYKWNEHLQIYGAIDNSLDTPPPAVVQSNGVNSFANPNTRADIYDALGRVFRAGLRFTY